MNMIEKIVRASGFLFCPDCNGTGENDYFCGHTVTTDCMMCGGHGVIKSLKKQKHRKQCSICSGRGGLGCCDKKGYYEWESYELIDSKQFDR